MLGSQLHNSALAFFFYVGLKVSSSDLCSKDFYRLNYLPSTVCAHVCVPVCCLSQLYLRCWDGFSYWNCSSQTWLDRPASKAQWCSLQLPMLGFQVCTPTLWWVFCFVTLYLIFLRQGLLLSLELRAVNQWTPVILLSLLGLQVQATMPSFFRAFWGSELRSSVFMQLVPIVALDMWFLWNFVCCHINVFPCVSFPDS